MRGCSDEAAPAAAAGVGPAVGFAEAAGAGEVESAAGRDDKNASDFPSGFQRGEFEDCGEVVNCHDARLPSVATVQIEELRRFCARSTFVTTYATNFPSGEIFGSLMNSNAK